MSFCALVATLVGCQSNHPITIVEKARRTRELRNEADECFRRFNRSHSQDLEALECLADKHRETVEMHGSPTLCPLCYLNYGRSVRLLGVYQWTLRNKLAQLLDSDKPVDRADVERRIQRANDEMRDYFRQSVEHLEMYLGVTTAGNRLRIQVYDWLSQQYGELGDYARALRYVTMLTQTAELNSHDRRIVEKRRNGYERLLENQQNERVRAALAN
ncbi:MAG: hypothetical protein O7J95_14185 [Planctomycetota bacterium]|nr:hypothetical protein [Planctomycetota bacterium]